ncbi:MAG TPA: restriction endonuclease [Candidatus Atribacteria bacterium]|nr:restriction endonuclease [Candidatus Atribacteria bacterium]
MEVKKGYKQTEIGIIPEDWEVDLLVNNVTKVGSGITPRGGEKVYKKEGIPFIRSQNIGWGKLLLDDVVYIDSITHSSFKETEIKLYDILLNITGASIGRCAIADEKIKNGNVNQHVCIIRTVKEKINPFYLGYLLLSQSGQSQIDSFQAGGNRQGLNFEQIKSFKIHIPPLHEQTAITNALSDIDALIESLEKVIIKKRNIKQGAMQQLLTGKKRLPGFGGDGISRKGYKQTEVGIIPEDWDVVRLGDVCSKIIDGTHRTPNYINDGIPFYSVENVTNNDFFNTKFISKQEHYQLIKRCKPEKGDILLTRIGTLGLTKLINWEVEASIYVSLALLKLNSLINNNYLYVFTKSKQFINNVEKRSLINAIPQKINMEEICKISIVVPTNKEEQTAIAEVLSDMDSEIEALEKKLNKYKKVKQGMMQELLTGKKRLI